MRPEVPQAVGVQIVQIGVRISHDMRDRLDAAATSEGITVAEAMRQALGEWLQRRETR